MAEPLLAAATLALVERGDLTLDDPVGQHLPEWAESAGLGYPCLPLFSEGVLRHTRQVHGHGLSDCSGRSGPKAKARAADPPPTIRHLLMHTAGIMPLDFE